jgi:hypothetical protein
VKSFDEVEETIKNFLLSNKQMEKWQEFITELMDGIEIDYKTSLKGQLKDLPETATDTAESEISE